VQWDSRKKGPITCWDGVSQGVGVRVHVAVGTKGLWQANTHLQLDSTRHVYTVALVLSLIVQCKHTELITIESIPSLSTVEAIYQSL
jgi:hypothetical protein